MGPGEQGGAHSARFDRTIGLDKEIGDEFKSFPTSQRWSNIRDLKYAPCNLVHELLAEQVTNDSGMLHKVQHVVNTSGWKAMYDKLQTSRADVPRYVDAVNFQTRDSCTGFWMINLAMEARLLA